MAWANKSFTILNLFLKKMDQQFIQKKIRTGLRTIELVQKNGKTGYHFKVNGEQVYIKGSNYFAQEMLLSIVTPDRHRQVIQSAKETNLNMLRVWGGGIYENDFFYDLCDEEGILVWQDFPFSKNLLQVDSQFIEAIEKEVEEQTIRLHHHPSLAFWNVNLENNAQEKLTNQSGVGKEQFSKSNNSKDSTPYNVLMSETIPEILKANTPSVPYWEFDPFNSDHFVNDWLIRIKDEQVPTIQDDDAGSTSAKRMLLPKSLPSLNTLTTFQKIDTDKITDEVDMNSDNYLISQENFTNDLNTFFTEPKDFESLVYLNQLLQAEQTKQAIADHQLSYPKSMGLILPQFNDCWPMASYSGIDYSGRWKAMQYYIKRVFNASNIIISEIDDAIETHIISNDLDNHKANTIIGLMDFNGKVLMTEEKKIKINKDMPERIWKKGKKDLLKKQKPEEIYLRARLYHEEQLLAEDVHFFVAPKDLKLKAPEIKQVFAEADGKLAITLTSDRTALAVFLNCDDINVRYSDNYFTLYPKESKTIEIFSKASITDIKNNLSIISLTDSYLP